MLYFSRILRPYITLAAYLGILAAPALAMAAPANTPVSSPDSIAISLPCQWTSATGTNLPCSNFVYPNYEAVNPPPNVQPEAYEGVPNGIIAPHDESLSIVSYPSTNFPLIDPVQKLELPDGSCQFIINHSSKTYFVPLRTSSEWADFVKAAPSINVDIYSCNAPPPGNPAQCGPANAVATTTAPSGTQLCSLGVPSGVVSTVTSSGNACMQSWSWTCTVDNPDNPASNAQLSAPCSAPSLATTTIATTTTTSTTVPAPISLGIILDASGSMETFDTATEAAVGTILPSILAKYPNVTLASVVVLGGNGYTPAVTGAGAGGFGGGRGGGGCYYGEVFGSAAPDGFSTTNDYGLGSVNDGSSTPLASAITYTAGFLNPSNTPGVQTAIIMLTDGAETCGGDFVGTVAQEVSNGVSMYGVAYQDASYEPQNFSSFTQYWPADSGDLTASIENALSSAVNEVTTTTTTSACQALASSSSP